MSVAYRPDIDGLRAVAVLAILLFHAHVPGFAGGYVGVDVFFVISGFLITKIIVTELDEGRFSFAGFYLRRIRRILPAFFVMLAVCGVVAWVKLYPKDLMAFGRAAAAAIAVVTNIDAWLQAGYFDPASHTKPLLHTWSLSVEEQFYLVLPPALVIAVRRGVPLAVLAWAGLVLSFAASVFWVREDPTGAFYLLPTRAWEFLVGSVLALRAVPFPRGRAAQDVFGLSGLFMIAAAVFAYDDKMRFPGEAALLPCLGAALVIMAKGPDRTPVAARLLSVRPMVFTGLVSYSLYLWHWPIIVFHQLHIVRAPTGAETIGLIAASFAAGTLSWRFVETPLRRAGAGVPALRVFAATGAVALVGIAVGLAATRDGFPQRWSAEMNRLFDQIEKPDMSFLALERPLAVPGIAHPDNAFLATRGGGPSDLVIWGDSHASALFPFVKQAIDGGRIRAATIFAKGGCRPLPGTWIAFDGDTTCHAHNAAVLEYLKTSPETRVMIVSRWGLSLYGDVRPRGLGDGRPSLAREPGVTMTVPEAEAFFVERLAATVDALLAHGKEVTIVEPIPEIPLEGKRVVWQALIAGQEPAGITVSIAEYAARYDAIERLFDTALGGKPVRRIALRRTLCPGDQCRLHDGGNVVWADNNHLTWEASAAVAGAFEAVLACSGPARGGC